MGAAKIFVTDIINDRLKVALAHGADFGGNPENENIVEKITGQKPGLLDTVFECCGEQSAIDQALDLLKPGGKLVWIAPAPEGFQPTRNDVQTLRPDVKRDRAHLERMLALLAAGAVRPPAIVRYKLADAAAAHRVSQARHLQGKLVLEVR